MRKSSTSTPLVSVVLPTFNRAQYVAEAIDSVLTQTFSDFELLVVDDGSSDETPRVLRRKAREDDMTVLNLENGLYYALEGSATVLWSRLQIGATPQELTRTLVAYGVEFDAEIAVEEFLATLASAGLTTSKAPDLAPRPVDEFEPEGELAPPMIEEFGDMAELLLLDPVHEIDPVMGWPAVPPPDN